MVLDQNGCQAVGHDNKMMCQHLLLYSSSCLFTNSISRPFTIIFFIDCQVGNTAHLFEQRSACITRVLKQGEVSSWSK